ncbi:MAG TPA: uroporphyrinogen-III C-methyltransferase [Rhizomicrobium sp.]|jgi:uroporphyrin-III C-methyltransferase|nr:uroporphyrinogen-III C-methyltransferase [Rhizomicrobium sp.]
MSAVVPLAPRDPLAALNLPDFARGSVWLAGAGPGDPGLITALGLHALRTADAVLYDALIDQNLLHVSRRGARRIHVGKRAGRASPRQSAINAMLIGLARRGLRVLRLKGGDPFVFGRGAEEALALGRAGVPFRIVPGVTAGIGGLAYAGIPVTHRDLNHAVTFITGHAADGTLAPLDWEAIARGAPTIVLYMARRFAGEIAARLIAAGRAPNEPAALVSEATHRSQAVAITTLSRLGETAKGATTPAIIVVGRNVELHGELDWLKAQAFAGPCSLARRAG